MEQYQNIRITPAGERPHISDCMYCVHRVHRVYCSIVHTRCNARVACAVCFVFYEQFCTYCECVYPKIIHSFEYWSHSICVLHVSGTSNLEIRFPSGPKSKKLVVRKRVPLCKILHFSRSQSLGPNGTHNYICGVLPGGTFLRICHKVAALALLLLQPLKKL